MYICNIIHKHEQNSVQNVDRLKAATCLYYNFIVKYFLNVFIYLKICNKYQHNIDILLLAYKIHYKMFLFFFNLIII